MLNFLKSISGIRNGFSKEYKVDSEKLFHDLAKRKFSAIYHLFSTAGPVIAKIGRDYKLIDEEIEEVINSAITETVIRIEQKRFEFRGHSPTTFTVEVGKKMLLMVVRKNKSRDNSSFVEYDFQFSDTYFSSFENENYVEKLLELLDRNCAKLIRLKYLEELKDEEIISGKLSNYSNINSLKANRSKCWKKLLELSKRFRTQELDE